MYLTKKNAEKKLEKERNGYKENGSEEIPSDTCKNKQSNIK